MPNYIITATLTMLLVMTVVLAIPAPHSTGKACGPHKTGHNEAPHPRTTSSQLGHAQLLDPALLQSSSVIIIPPSSVLNDRIEPSVSPPVRPQKAAPVAVLPSISDIPVKILPVTSAQPATVATTSAAPPVLPLSVKPPTEASVTRSQAPASTPSIHSAVNGDSDSNSPVGLAVDYLSNAKANSFGTKVSWYLSWTLSEWPGMEGLNFVPMIKNAEMVNAFKPEQLGKAKYALSLNEPDIASQHGGTKLTEGTAAILHKQWTSQVPQGVKIGSVVVANGGKGYWDTWKSACGSDCRYDFIPIHFYGLDAADFISYAKQWANEGKPVWVTELACRAYRDGKIIKCSDEDSRKMMIDSIKWMRGEGSSYIKRWAWFGAWQTIPEDKDTVGALLGQDGNANALGKFYGSL